MTGASADERDLDPRTRAFIHGVDQGSELFLVIRPCRINLLIPPADLSKYAEVVETIWREKPQVRYQPLALVLLRMQPPKKSHAQRMKITLVIFNRLASRSNNAAPGGHATII